MPEWQYRYGDRSFTTKSPRSNIYSPIFIRSVSVHFPRFSTLPISRHRFVLKAHEKPPVVTQTRGAPFPRSPWTILSATHLTDTDTPNPLDESVDIRTPATRSAVRANCDNPRGREPQAPKRTGEEQLAGKAELEGAPHPTGPTGLHPCPNH